MPNTRRMERIRVDIISRWNSNQRLRFNRGANSSSLYAWIVNPANATSTIQVMAAANNMSIDDIAWQLNYYIRRLRRTYDRHTETPRATSTTTRTATPATLPDMKLTLTGQPANTIDLNKYSHNLCVGFEFEFNWGTRGDKMTTVCQKYGVKEGKTNGQIKSMQQIKLYDGSSISVPVNADAYKQPGVVTQVYRDGSVDCEIVTRPLLIAKIDDAKPVFDYIKSPEIGGRMKISRAGLHMTFLLDQHMEHSNFDRQVVKNVIQLVRAYYPGLIVGFNQGAGRPTQFRNIPTGYYSDSLSCSHSDYYAVATRRTLDNKIWAIEIRTPDGTDDWEQVKQQVLFYSALIRHAAKVAKKGGVINFPQQVWDSNRNFYDKYSSRGEITATDKATFLSRYNELAVLLQSEIRYFTFNEGEDLAQAYGQTQTVTVPTN